MLGLVNLPTDNPLNRVYRFGAAAIGLGLLVFGMLGYFNQLAFFDTAGADKVAGLSTNVLLSTISVVVGIALIGGAIAGGNVSALLNATIGTLFIGSGLANLTVLRTSWNFLNFSMSNVIFSFVAGLLLLTFGLYGRVSGGLPPDNPYYRGRHGLDPETGEVVDEEKAVRTGALTAGSASPAPRASDRGVDPRQLTAADAPDSPAARTAARQDGAADGASRRNGTTGGDAGRDSAAGADGRQDTAAGGDGRQDTAAGGDGRQDTAAGGDARPDAARGATRIDTGAARP